MRTATVVHKNGLMRMTAEYPDTVTDDEIAASVAGWLDALGPDWSAAP